MKVAVRSCPICDGYWCEVLRTQKFVLPQDHLLADGYDVLCCQDCGFVYADIVASQQDYDAYYARCSKYEDSETSTGGGGSTWDAERLQETAANIAEMLPDKRARVLDVGCANGGLLRCLRELGYANLCGLDPSAACVENVRVLHGIPAYQGSLSSVPDDLGLYDCVILSHVLEHVQSVRLAVHRIHQLTRPGGIAYVEVPDASRYAEFVVAPFQDFNTEHINHFSQQSLTAAFRSGGWGIRSYGYKVILSAPDAPYPATYGFYVKGERPAHSLVLERDPCLCGRIRQYIARSQEIMDALAARLADALQGSPEVIVWGTGQLAMKLLAETPLGTARIKAFVDGNPANRGMVLQGIPILSPDQISGMQFPIIVSSVLHQEEIGHAIRTKWALANDIILLRP